MENHYYECIHDILSRDMQPGEKRAALHRYKAKLVTLHAERNRKIFLDVRGCDRVDDEEPTLFHIVRQKQRQKARDITHVTDRNGVTFTTHREIACNFVTDLRRKYAPISVDEKALETMLQDLRPSEIDGYRPILEQPITPDELEAAIRKSAKQKSPGIDGISLDFYYANWSTIRSDLLNLMNHMFLDKHVSPRQKRGIICSLPKCSHPHTTQDYRPISLLPTDYKILARILANRIRHILEDQMTSSQYCGVPGNSMLDTVSIVRDVTA
jgi:hypothetical protein